MKNFKRLLSLLLVLCGISVLMPVQANASWKQNSTGWWYTEGNSWATGWRNVNNVWYYFDSNGYMKTGWQNVNGKWYYFYQSGSMACNVTIDGKYYLDSTGAWDNITKSTSVKTDIKEDTKKDLTLDEAKNLVLKEDGIFINDYINKYNYKYKLFKLDYKPEAELKAFKITEEPSYVFGLCNYNPENDEILEDKCVYLVGKNTHKIYCLPNQGQMNAYIIKDNKIETTLKCSYEKSYDWRK